MSYFFACSLSIIFPFHPLSAVRTIPYLLVCMLQVSACSARPPNISIHQCRCFHVFRSGRNGFFPCFIQFRKKPVIVFQNLIRGNIVILLQRCIDCTCTFRLHCPIGIFSEQNFLNPLPLIPLSYPYFICMNFDFVDSDNLEQAAHNRLVHRIGNYFVAVLADCTAVDHIAADGTQPAA